MELMVRNGDYVSDGAGGFLRAEGTDELLQRVLWKLSIPRGSFPLLPALGSELHRLGPSPLSGPDWPGSMWPRHFPMRRSCRWPGWSCQQREN